MLKWKKSISELMMMVQSPVFDVKIAEELQEKISHYEKIIAPKIGFAYNELKRYMINDSHNVYKKRQQDVKAIEEIDIIARKLLASLGVVSNKLNSHQGSMQQIALTISVRKRQVQSSESSNKLGF